MGALRIILISLALALSGAGAGFAQSLGQIVSPVVTLDRERLFNDSLFGQRVKQELAAETAQMIAETSRIEDVLAKEEKTLTEQRATLDQDAFRALAQAFDEKVQNLRAEREQAQSDLQDKIQAAQNAFFQQVGPILGQLLRDRGAVMIIDRRAVLLSAVDVDITDAAIIRVNEVLGDGAAVESSDTDTAAPGDETLDTIPAPDTTVPEADPSTDTDTASDAGQ